MREVEVVRHVRCALSPLDGADAVLDPDLVHTMVVVVRRVA